MSSNNKSSTSWQQITKYVVPLLFATITGYVAFKTCQKKQKSEPDVRKSTHTEIIDYDDDEEEYDRPKQHIIATLKDTEHKEDTEDIPKLIAPSKTPTSDIEEVALPRYRRESILTLGYADMSQYVPDQIHLTMMHWALASMQYTQKQNANKNNNIPQIMAPPHFLGESSYRETVIFILAFACNRLFPSEELVIENTFRFGSDRKCKSYLCRFPNDCFNLNVDVVDSINNEMRNICSMEYELHSRSVSYEKCLKMLENKNQLLSAKLVGSLNKSYYKMVGVDDMIDGSMSFYILQYRSLLHNTKYCTNFSLHSNESSTNNTFIICFDFDAESYDDNKIEWRQPNALKDLFDDSLRMSKILNCKCVADINMMIQNGRFSELMLNSESYHNYQIVKIAQQIYSKSDKLRIILISGPSSAGKTTFASKLGVLLRFMGFIPSVLEVDMFYKNRNDPTHPRDDKGHLNFEIIEALQKKELNETIVNLLNGKKVEIPNFDFIDGERKGYKKEILELDENDGILIMEGIFCLNPSLFDLNLITNINAISYKIFISPISPFYNLDNFHFISEQVTRLVRRISRDHFHRGRGAQHTVFKWGQLKHGEDINIFPFIKYANSVFNSSLIYELCILKVYSYPLLQTVNIKSTQYKDTQNLLSFLDCFLTMPCSKVPSDSLLMEFIGKSIFDDL